MFFSKDYLYNLVTYKIKGPIAVLLRGFLFLFSLLYGLVVVVLAGFYRIRPARLGAKVISVGNITLGGTGKTSLVEYLCRKLNSEGKKVAVLSRGYKRALGVGDEPLMLEKKLPFIHVVVDKNRIKGAAKAIKDYAPDLLILDDGMQQWRIFKDLEIITLDANNPFGNFKMLPAGFLREPLSALKRADIFVLTQTNAATSTDNLINKLKQINPQASIIESVYKPKGFISLTNPDKVFGPELLNGKSVALFSGIGNPQGFENSIQILGINIAKSFRFADHYTYTQADIDGIIQFAKDKNLDAVITTQKDAVKILALKTKEFNILVLDIQLNIIKNEAESDRRLFKLFSF